MDIITIEKNGRISQIETITSPQKLALYRHMEREHTKLVGASVVREKSTQPTTRRYIPAAKQASAIIRGVMRDLFK